MTGNKIKMKQKEKEKRKKNNCMLMPDVPICHCSSNTSSAVKTEKIDIEKLKKQREKERKKGRKKERRTSMNKKADRLKMK
jgi:hypothetical protein